MTHVAVIAVFLVSSVRDYDTASQTFPQNLLAGIFSFRDALFFVADHDDRQVPEVDLFEMPSRPSAAPGETPAPPDGAPAG
ncbi:LemA family protein [Frankia sp. AgB1.8]